MKKKFVVIILSTILSGLFSCTSKTDKPQIITVKFGGNAQDSIMIDDRNEVGELSNNVFIRYLSDEEGQVSLPADEYDLLLITDNLFSKSGVFYEYDIKDGNDLEFLISDSISYLNGHPMVIYYNNSYRAERFLNSLPDNEIKQLKYLYLELDTVPGDLPQVDRVARLNPHVKIISNEAAVTAALDRFNPEFLYIIGDNCCDTVLIEKIISEESIQRLIFESYYGFELNMILKLPHLRKLEIQNLEKFDPGQPLIRNSSLEILSLNGAFTDINFYNLDFLVNLENLKQIAVTGTDTSLDISCLEKLEKLESVNLLGNQVTGLSALKDLRSLESFCFPVNISQHDFNEFISDHQELNFIKMYACEKVLDYSSLLELKNLEFLVICGIDSSFTAESMRGFDKLDYLSIGPVNDGDSTLISEVKALLPETIVNENAGICLGSGYLLLVIPLFLVISMIFMVCRRRLS